MVPCLLFGSSLEYRHNLFNCGRDAGKDQKPSRDREREKERERAGGKEQRSETVESTMDVKNYVSIRDVPYSSADNDQKSMTVVDLFDLIHLFTNIMHR